MEEKIKKEIVRKVGSNRKREKRKMNLERQGKKRKNEA